MTVKKLVRKFNNHLELMANLRAQRALLDSSNIENLSGEQNGYIAVFNVPSDGKKLNHFHVLENIDSDFVEVFNIYNGNSPVHVKRFVFPTANDARRACLKTGIKFKIYPEKQGMEYLRKLIRQNLIIHGHEKGKLRRRSEQVYEKLRHLGGLATYMGFSKMAAMYARIHEKLNSDIDNIFVIRYRMGYAHEQYQNHVTMLNDRQYEVNSEFNSTKEPTLFISRKATKTMVKALNKRLWAKNPCYVQSYRSYLEEQKTILRRISQETGNPSTKRKQVLNDLIFRSKYM